MYIIFRNKNETNKDVKNIYERSSCSMRYCFFLFYISICNHHRWVDTMDRNIDHATTTLLSTLNQNLPKRSIEHDCFYLIIWGLSSWIIWCFFHFYLSWNLMQGTTNISISKLYRALGTFQMFLVNRDGQLTNWALTERLQFVEFVIFHRPLRISQLF